MRRFKVIGIALAVGLLFSTIASPPATATDPWAGSVTLTASTQSTQPSGPNSLLTATLSEALRDGLDVSIWSSTGVRLLCQWSTAFTEFGVNATPAAATTERYTVYVSDSCTSSTSEWLPPDVDIRASAHIDITNTGWPGTVSLSASSVHTTTSSPNSLLTATLSENVAAPYSVSIYRSDGTRVACSSSTSALTLSAWATPGTDETVGYTAYVAQNCPSEGAPTADVRSESDFAVSNIGWQGSFTATSNGATPSSVVTVSMSIPLVGYCVAAYDEGENRMAAFFSGSSNGFWVTLPTVGTRTVRIYAARSCPSESIPTMVRSSTTMVFTSTGQTSQRMDGVDVDQLASALSSVSEEEMLLLLTQAGSRFGLTSTSEQANAYAAARALGRTRAQALRDCILGLSAAAGAGVLIYVATHIPGATDPAPPASPPAPSDAPLNTPINPGAITYEDKIVSIFMELNTQLSERDARTAARTCISNTTIAISLGALSALQGNKRPCEGGIDIFLPGSSQPNVTLHDAYALATTPTWIRLNYVSQRDRRKTLTRGWYNTHVPCNDKTGVTVLDPSCDEFPFFSTAQAGPGASLRWINLTENVNAGARLGNMVVACGMTSGGPVPAAQNLNGSPFLVIPLVTALAPPTTYICRDKS